MTISEFTLEYGLNRPVGGVNTVVRNFFTNQDGTTAMSRSSGMTFFILRRKLWKKKI